MTATNDQIVAEASRRAIERGWGAPPVEHYIIEVAREGWTPPEPVVDPDVLAWRKWMAEQWPDLQEEAISGETDSIMPAQAYLAGARMAREQERERAEVLVEYVEIDAVRLDGVGGRARNVLAKYRGEA